MSVYFFLIQPIHLSVHIINVESQGKRGTLGIGIWTMDSLLSGKKMMKKENQWLLPGCLKLGVKRVPWNLLCVLCFFACGVLLLRMSMAKKRFLFKGITETPIVREVMLTWDKQLLYQAKLPPISGFRNSETKFLAIGIATVYRSENYILKTLNSFINESTPENRENVVIIIYLADTDSDRKQMQLKLIQDNFQFYLDSGFIQVIESQSSIYPPMDFALTKRTFDDPLDRVVWRAKQVIDFAFLFSYAKNISDYYLVAEDDIITANEYISAIRDFVQKKQHLRWVALEFSEFLGIGLLFRNSDLPALVELLMMFYQYQPVDMLMRQFISIQVQDQSEPLKRIPSIFQHHGKNSTLPNKTQKQIDYTFGLADRKFKNQNPKANLSTTMGIYNGLTPDLPYKSAPGYFWGIPKPEAPGNVFDIVFDEPLNVSRVVIFTGIPSDSRKIKLKDLISDGYLQMSDKCEKSTEFGKTKCKYFQHLETFKDGDLDVSSDLVNVQCFRIKLGRSQATWVIIREIEIFLNKLLVSTSKSKMN